MVNDHGRRIIENASIHIDIPIKISRKGSELTDWTACEGVDCIARARPKVKPPTFRGPRHSAPAATRREAVILCRAAVLPLHSYNGSSLNGCCYNP
jgi:hypothetical protein